MDFPFINKLIAFFRREKDTPAGKLFEAIAEAGMTSSVAAAALQDVLAAFAVAHPEAAEVLTLSGEALAYIAAKPPAV